MKATKLLFPLALATFLTGCVRTGGTTYNPENTAKYAANKIDGGWSDLPRKGYYVAGKEFSNTTIDILKEQFHTYLPAEFKVTTDWYENTLDDGTPDWEIIFENTITVARGELYYRSESVIQLWVVTYPISEK